MRFGTAPLWPMLALPLILLAMSLSQFSACLALLAGTRDDDVPDQKYLDYAEDFAPYTVRLISWEPRGDDKVWEVHATATLLSDHWAITAAHMVEDAVKVEVDGREASRFIVHPKYSESVSGILGYDVALVRVEKSFGRKFYPPLSDGGEKPGAVVSIVGFGVCGPMSTGHDNQVDGCLRAGTARIDHFEPSRIICMIRRGDTPLPYGISPGDSGGPLFCGGKLAGVNSFAFGPERKPAEGDGKPGRITSKAGDGQAFARISDVREWIEETMAQGAVR
jgi:hypothetical protein